MSSPKGASFKNSPPKPNRKYTGPVDDMAHIPSSIGTDLTHIAHMGHLCSGTWNMRGNGDDLGVVNAYAIAYELSI